MTCSPCALRRSRRSTSTRPWSADGSSTSARAGLLARFLAAALLLAGVAAGAMAHELRAIRGSGRFQKDGTYVVDAVGDRQHLPPGLGSSGTLIQKGSQPVENLTPELEKRIGPLIADAINGVSITFDGNSASPRVALVLPEGGAAAVADAGEITIRFTGEIPGGSKSFQWQNAGAPGSNMLTIRNEGDEAASRQ